MVSRRQEKCSLFHTNWQILIKNINMGCLSFVSKKRVVSGGGQVIRSFSIGVSGKGGLPSKVFFSVFNFLHHLFTSLEAGSTARMKMNHPICFPAGTTGLVTQAVYLISLSFSFFFLFQLSAEPLHPKHDNRPFPKYLWPLFQSQSRCLPFIWKLLLIHMQMKTDFHVKRCRPELLWKRGQR